MGNIDYIKALVELIEHNPITTAAIGGAVIAVARFFRPLLEAIRRAWIRRIDQAWPNEGGHEERVRKAVETLSTSPIHMPRSMIEREVRKHKTTPPPAPPGGESGE
jgi:hypothetical protein